jgi:hypothetical protein
MDFSLHEQRRLAQIEKDLSADRRLVALMGLLASPHRKTLRLLRCLALRLRHPWFASSSPTGGFARLALVAAFALSVAAPPALITSLVFGILVLTVVSLVAIPMAVTLLVLSYRWTFH